MYADRHVRAKPNPVSLTAAVGINAALVAALLLSAPEIIRNPGTITEIFDVRDKPPPPPKPDEPTKVEKTAQPTRPTIPDRVVDVPETTDVTLAGDPLPPIGPVDLGPPTTGGGTGVTLDPPKPKPVFTDAAPDPRAEFQPDYPPSERRAGVEGKVVVRVLVGANGRVTAVEQVSSIGDAFFAATRRQALSRWRFKPATRDGIPYESWRTMTVRFVLEG